MQDLPIARYLCDVAIKAENRQEILLADDPANFVRHYYEQDKV